MARRGSRSKKLSRFQKIAALVCCLILAASGGIIWREQSKTANAGVSSVASGASAAAGSELQIHVIDVGNADSILITSAGHAMLIDAGENNDGDNVVAYIRSHNVSKLDYVVASHPDSDHIGGMADVITNITVGTFIMSIMPKDITPTSKTYLNMLKALESKNLDITEAKVDTSYTLGGTSFTILGPVGTFDSTNNMSVVCRFTYGSRHFLFMGDAEKEAENALLSSGADLSADFIKIGHHGSSTSSQKKFLQTVNPRYAAISCSADNDYGHPATSTLKTLKALDVTYYRTDLNGTITVTSDGKTISVSTEK